MTALESAARAVAVKFAVDWDRASADQKESAADVARTALMAVRDEVKEYRVYTDGFNWIRGRNGPFIVWDELDAAIDGK